jgi:hypothetical protein
LGVCVCGGKGGVSRRTPAEIAGFCELTGQDGEQLAQASRMAAKVDSACVQDGYQLYHHAFIFSVQNEWAVVQQGMCEADSTARRYHWLGDERELAQLRAALAGQTRPGGQQLALDFAQDARQSPAASEPPRAEAAAMAGRQFSAPDSAAKSFVCEPHAAVAAQQPAAAPVLNLVAGEAEDNRAASVTATGLAPSALLKELSRLPQDALVLPRRHDLRPQDVAPGRLERILLRTYERQPGTYEALVALPGVGAKTLRALSLVAEVIYGRPASFRDPARFAYAHGGKDGHPYPVDRAVYDQVIRQLGETVSKARVAHSEKSSALKRLAEWGRAAG